MKSITILLIALIISLSTIGQETKVITSDGVELYVKVKGEGTPCLYIHGGPNSGSYWAEKFTGDLFEKHFQMIYLDQRGCCRSTSPKDNEYSMNRMIKDFEEVRKALGIKKWVTMSHSFGGLTQTGYSKKHPEVIEGMIMICSTLNWNKTMINGFFKNACKELDIPFDFYKENDSISIPERAQILIDKLVEKDVMWKFGFSSKENANLLGQVFGEIKNFNWSSEKYIINHSSYKEDFTQYSKDIELPVLFVYGQKDISVGLEHYKDIKFPNMILWKVNSGHMPFMEDKEGLDKSIIEYRKVYHL